MKKFEQEKLIEVVLYILNMVKGLDFYHVFKILYFAEEEHLKLWGNRITDDDFVHMDYGPVPTHLYGAVKDRKEYEPNLTSLFQNAITFAKEDAQNVLIAKRNSNPDYLSKSDIECIDKSIKENANLTFDQLCEKSHDSAYNSVSNLCIITPLVMAKAAGANDDMIDYITQQMNVQKTLA